MTSEEEEFSHLHIMLALLSVENIKVCVCVYYVDKCISKLLLTFSDQHQQQEYFFKLRNSSILMEEFC